MLQISVGMKGEGRGGEEEGEGGSGEGEGRGKGRGEGVGGRGGGEKNMKTTKVYGQGYLLLRYGIQKIPQTQTLLIAN